MIKWLDYDDDVSKASVVYNTIFFKKVITLIPPFEAYPRYWAKSKLKHLHLVWL